MAEVSKEVHSILQYQDIPFQTVIEKVNQQNQSYISPHTLFKIGMNVEPTFGERTVREDFGAGLILEYFETNWMEEEHYEVSFFFDDNLDDNFRVRISFLDDVY
eukprot:TRINITY_DN3801_c0_g2_i16.p1 TRINITY_DN3801_c0_g2~~TRINITY_DN3801_c0_g2_i16.p1  ORF type:complete len:104 (+),score=21.56 TRINITY_DN3801_c0_g2_i16:472-783(+)